MRITRSTLPNGLVVSHVATDGMPNEIAASLVVHAGSLEEEEADRGLAHLLEHITAAGSQRRRRILQAGGAVSAITDFDRVTYSVSANTPRFTNRLLATLAEMAFQPQWRQSLLNQEKAAVMAESVQVADLSNRIAEAQLTTLHEDTLLASRLVLGLPRCVGKATFEQLKRFHAKHYSPSTSSLYVVGGQSAAVLREVNIVFGQYRAQPKLPGRGVRVDRWHKPQLDHSWATTPLLPPTSTGRVHRPNVIVHRHIGLATDGLIVSVAAKSPIQRSLRRLTAVDIGDMDSNGSTWLHGKLIKWVAVGILTRRLATSQAAGSSISFEVQDESTQRCNVKTLAIRPSQANSWPISLRDTILFVRAAALAPVTLDEIDALQSAFLADTGLHESGASTLPAAVLLEDLIEADALGQPLIDAALIEELLRGADLTVDAVQKQIAEITSELLGLKGAPSSASRKIVVHAPSPLTEASGQCDGYDDTEAITAAVLRAFAPGSHLRWPRLNFSPSAPSPFALPPHLRREGASARESSPPGPGPALSAQLSVQSASTFREADTSGWKVPLGACEGVRGSSLWDGKLANAIVVRLLDLPDAPGRLHMRFFASGSSGGGITASDGVPPQSHAVDAAAVKVAASLLQSCRPPLDALRLGVDATSAWSVCTAGGLEFTLSLPATVAAVKGATEIMREQLEVAITGECVTPEAVSAGVANWLAEEQLLSYDPEAVARRGTEGLSLQALQDIGKQLTPRRVSAALASTLRPEQMEVAVAGCINGQNLLAALSTSLERTLTTLPPSPLSPPSESLPPRRSSTQASEACSPPVCSKQVARLGLPAGTTQAAAHISGRLAEVRATPLARLAAQEVLERVVNARLYSTLRDAQGLVYQATSRFKDDSYTITLMAAPDAVEAASASALEVMRALAKQDQPVTRRELRIALRGVHAVMEERRRSPEWCVRQLQATRSGVEDTHAAAKDGPFMELLLGRGYEQELKFLKRKDLYAPLEGADEKSVQVIASPGKPQGFSVAT